MHNDRVIGKARCAVPFRDLVPKHRPDGTVDIANWHLDTYRFFRVERWCSEANQVLVEGRVETVVLHCRTVECLSVGVARNMQDR